MDFKTNVLKTGTIAKELLSTKVGSTSCYALLTTGRVIQFDCKSQEEAEQIEKAINKDSSYQMEKEKMGFDFKIVVHQTAPHHSY